MKAVFAALVFFMLSPGWAAGGPALDFPVNLAQAQPAAVVILFSVPDCAYCEQLRRHTLRHVPKERAYKGRVAVYEIEFTEDNRKLVWFDGKRHTGKSIAAMLDVKFSPTVIVFNRKGMPAGKPILGAGLPEFYASYLDELVQAAWALNP
jgi:hypothetical protein